MNILCTICARKGSQGLKNKNIANLNGKPLIIHTLNQAKKIKFIKDIVVSTNSKFIQKIVGKKYSWFIRPEKISDSKSSKIIAIRHAIIESEKKNNCVYDLVIDLDVTSPLRTIKDVLNSFKLFKKKKINNLFSVSEPRKNPYFNIVEHKKNKHQTYAPVKKIQKIYSRQAAPKVYEMNAAIYIWKRDVIFSKNPLFNKKTDIFIMPRERSIDIDDTFDLKIVKHLKK